MRKKKTEQEEGEVDDRDMSGWMRPRLLRNMTSNSVA